MNATQVQLRDCRSFSYQIPYLPLDDLSLKCYFDKKAAETFLSASPSREVCNFNFRQDNQDYIQPVAFMYMKPPHVIAEDHIRIYNIQLPRFREQTHDLRKPLDAWLYLLDTAHQEHISLDEVIEMEPTLQEAIDLDAGLKQFTEGYSRASADPEVQEEYRKYTSELLRVTGMLHAAEAKGEARGETKERLRAIQNLMETTSMSAEQAMRALKILESEMSNYINQLHRSHDIVRSD